MEIYYKHSQHCTTSQLWRRSGYSANTKLSSNSLEIIFLIWMKTEIKCIKILLHSVAPVLRLAIFYGPPFTRSWCVLHLSKVSHPETVERETTMGVLWDMGGYTVCGGILGDVQFVIFVRKKQFLCNMWWYTHRWINNLWFDALIFSSYLI